MQQRLASGEPALCFCIMQGRTPDIVMIAAACDYDAIYIDLEHSPTSLDSASMLCSTAHLAGMACLIRTASQAQYHISCALDAGAGGVIVPHVETVAQAQAIVSASHFPPIGTRSIIGPNPATSYAPLSTVEQIALLDRQTLVAPMIESQKGIDAVEAIAAVNGVDMIMIGPHDLSADMGIPGQVGHGEVRGALERVAQACKEHGKIFGIAGISDPEQLRWLIGLGLGFVSLGSDTGFLMQAAQARASTVRSMLQGGAAQVIRSSSY